MAAAGLKALAAFDHNPLDLRKGKSETLGLFDETKLFNRFLRKKPESALASQGLF